MSNVENNAAVEAALHEKAQLWRDLLKTIIAISTHPDSDDEDRMLISAIMNVSGFQGDPEDWEAARRARRLQNTAADVRAFLELRAILQKAGRYFFGKHPASTCLICLEGTGGDSILIGLDNFVVCRECYRFATDPRNESSGTDLPF